MRTRERRGFTLIELIVLVVVIAAGLVGLLTVYVSAGRGSAEPVVQKQALAIGGALLEEAQLSSYDSVAGTGPTRDQFNDVLDFNGYATTGVETIDGTPIPGLGAYNVSISVATPGLNGVAEARLITVTVTGPAGVNLALSGYRVKYPCVAPCP